MFLGVDKNIEVNMTPILPTQRTKEEDISGWFVTEKKKYRMKIEDMAVTVTSTYDK